MERILKQRPVMFRLMEGPFWRPGHSQRSVQFGSLNLGDFDLGDLRASLSKLQLPFWVDISSPGHPDKKRLMTVHDFFQYTEKQGRTVREGRV